MTGWPSPNHGPRVGVAAPSLIVLHYTGMATAAEARARLCDPAAEVSAHWLIAEDGAPEALVPEERRAWHAGAGSWRGQEDINSRSVGIEIANPGYRPFAAAQMDMLERLLGRIMARWSIGPEGVIAHSDMAPGRKLDPGPRFDWARLARQGLALHPAGCGPDLPLDESLTRIGYPVVEPEKRLAAFRLRFRPGAHGPETETDRRIAAAAAALFPA
ncbi:MAG: N-acetylmuramoyl-L-alanine amidase [Paracoccus sp. (in: a-proteobacteria)]|nr:N-acetylmuramoyl-L-alanine amidase [Paracoccus sp. (in: a-proteobacteria)]